MHYIVVCGGSVVAIRPHLQILGRRQAEKLFGLDPRAFHGLRAVLCCLFVPYPSNQLPFTSSRMAIRKKGSVRPLTFGEAISVLQTFPGHQYLDVLKDDEKHCDFVSWLVAPFCGLSREKTASRKAEGFEHHNIEIPPEISEHFGQWKEDPQTFWARCQDPESLPKYLEAEACVRPCAFLDDVTRQYLYSIQDRVRLNFGAVSVYELFKRVFPSSSDKQILKQCVEKFVELLQGNPKRVNNYTHVILVRQRITNFCRKLGRKGSSRIGYGPLFFAEFPDV